MARCSECRYSAIMQGKVYCQEFTSSDNTVWESEIQYCGKFKHRPERPIIRYYCPWCRGEVEYKQEECSECGKVLKW